MKQKDASVMIDLLWQDFAEVQVAVISAKNDSARQLARKQLKRIHAKILKLETNNAR